MKDYALNVLEKHGGKGLFPNYQSNTDISFLNLLLLPNKISNAHRTNAVLVSNDFEDEILFSRIELLDPLPSVLFDCVEED